MADHDLDHLKTVYAQRYLAEGVPYGEWLRIRDSIASTDAWCAVWSDFARASEARANAALAEGHNETAAIALRLATLEFCFGQLLFWHDPATKEKAYADCARVWRRAAPLLDPPQEPVAIPYRGITMAGFLRRPKGTDRAPCVILLGGLDSTKE